MNEGNEGTEEAPKLDIERLKTLAEVDEDEEKSSVCDNTRTMKAANSPTGRFRKLNLQIGSLESKEHSQELTIPKFYMVKE